MVKKREKNRITKERIYKGYSILLIAVFVLTPLVGWAHTAQDPEISPLIAGQDFHNPVGEVLIWNDDENLYVKYKTNDLWYMTETHLYVGTTLPPTPVAPESFPHSYENSNGFSEQTYTVSLSELGVQPEEWVYILAHAEGEDSEMAWKGGIPIEEEDGDWAMYNTYQIQKFPWLKVSISGTELVWDIFKPGRYMSIGPVFRIASNVGVTILYGTGGPNSALGPAERTRSLLSKNSGSPDDEIRLWATWLRGEPSSPHRGDPGSVPPADQISNNPEDLFDYWVEFSHLDSYEMKISDSEELKKGIAFSWYNMISVDPSYSEGNYFEQFVITISGEL